MKFPRVIAALSLVVLSAGCSTGESLPLLKLGGAGGTRDAAGNELASDSPLSVGRNVVYTTKVTDWGDAGTAHEQSWPTWTFVPPTSGADTKKELSRVARAFGLSGDVTEVAGAKGTWRLVDETKGLTLDSIGDAHARQWSVYVTANREKAVADCPPGAECAVPVPDDITTSTIPTGHLTSESDAKKAAERILRDIGVDTSVDVLGWTSSRSEYGTYVSASHEFRGEPTQMSWGFTFGADATIEYASGPMFTLLESDSYPVIDVAAAIERLNKGVGFVHGAARTMSSDTADELNREITGARVSVAPWWLAEGTMMLLPAYTFILADSSEVSVVAVLDAYIEFPDVSTVDTAPTPDTGGGTSGSSSGSSAPYPGSSNASLPGSSATPPDVTALPVAQARVLIGLTLEEAQKVCDSKGWTLRIASLEGDTRFLTTDFQFNRVNVTILKGFVTDVTVG